MFGSPVHTYPSGQSLESQHSLHVDTYAMLISDQADISEYAGGSPTEQHRPLAQFGLFVVSVVWRT